MANRSFFANFNLLNSLTPGEQSALQKKITEKKYTKGQTIFMEGDPAKYVWFVKEGHVKAVVHSADGRDRALCVVGSNQMFGTCCCLNVGEYACESVAETDVTAICLPVDDFMALMEKNAKFSKAVALQLSQRLSRTKGDQTVTQQTVEQRVLHTLIGLCGEFGNTIPLTRREIAEMVGTSVETCIRTFGKLEEAGLVNGARGKIMVKSVQILRDRLEKG